MGASVAQKTNPRWRWHALEHRRGQVWASVLGRRQDTGCLARQALWAPWGITRFDPAGGGAYERPSTPEQPVVGKQHTQKIASKPINRRTRIQRLVRRTMCFSTTTTLPDLVVGLFINRYEFGRLS
jgi:insertion element IS1 protein InsB